MADSEKKSFDGNVPEQITGADAVLRSLIAEGIDTIFGYPGGAIIQFTTTC